MKEQEIIKKLKNDIASRKESYQKELEKIQKDEMLLQYMKGMLDITESNVSNFPYYDQTEDESDARLTFNEMLKYTLKEDSIIKSFQTEIKNLYFLEKIGYQHAPQYQETVTNIMSFREKIAQAYNQMITNQNLEEFKSKKKNILLKLDNLIKLVEEENQEVEDLDGLYEKLELTSLKEVDKTEILLLFLKRNTILQSGHIHLLKELIKEKSSFSKKRTLLIATKDYLNIKELLQDSTNLKKLIRKKKLAIKITINGNDQEEIELQKLKQEIKQEFRKLLITSSSKSLPQKSITSVEKIISILKSSKKEA